LDTGSSLRLYGGFTVVHPLNDRPERKCSDEGLGPTKMSDSVRISFFALRAYLIAMAGLVVYRLLDITVFIQR
jgi:hypothetical protein